MKIISWNVNGIRAAQRKGLLGFLAEQAPDILSVQETKAHKEQLDDELLEPPGYRTIWMSAERKGYSGVASFVRDEPRSVDVLGVPEFDIEGRVQILEYPDFTLVNAYFPNSGEQCARVDYKVAFCDALMARCNELRAAGRNVVICGDYNVAHKPIDLREPEKNEGNAGYLAEEREWMDRFVAAGYVDTFRMFNRDPGHYTWWSYRFRARQRDIGWRIDYFCVNEEFRQCVTASTILKDVMGSDHCPIVLTIA